MNANRWLKADGHLLEIGLDDICVRLTLQQNFSETALPFPNQERELQRNTNYYLHLLAPIKQTHLPDNLFLLSNNEIYNLKG